MNLQEMVRARNNYAYPPFHLTKCSEKDAKWKMWGIPVAVVGPSPKDWPRADLRTNFSSKALDDYHESLLSGQANSLEAAGENQLIGLASVLFWGFAAGADSTIKLPRAEGKAKQLINGKRSKDSGAPIKPPQSPSEILEHLFAARHFISNHNVALALLAVMKIKFFKMAFASKVLMFMAPNRCSVYDDVIFNRFNKLGSQDPLKQFAVNPRRFRVGHADTYSRWAEHCRKQANFLNEDITRQWTDWDGRRYDWRAVDVERAYFALGR